MASDYSIEIATTAVKALGRIEKYYRVKISTEIKALSTDPRPHGCTKLTGRTDAHRIRIGEYRVGYTINDTIRIIRVEKIGHRREIYR